MSPARQKLSESPDFDALVDRIVVARPWRGFWYGIYYFCRLWALFFYTVLFCVTTQQPIILSVTLLSLAFWADFSLRGKRAFDLHASDREFVETICREQVTKCPVSPAEWHTLKQLFLILSAVAALCYVMPYFFSAPDTCATGSGACVWLSIYTQSYLYFMFLCGAGLVAAFSYLNPIGRVPPVIDDVEIFDIYILAKSGYVAYSVEYKTTFSVFILTPVIITINLYVYGLRNISSKFWDMMNTSAVFSVNSMVFIFIVFASTYWKSEAIAESAMALKQSGEPNDDLDTPNCLPV